MLDLVRRPLEEVGEEGEEVGENRIPILIGGLMGLEMFDVLQMNRTDILIRKEAKVLQGRGGDHQSLGLEVPNPPLVVFYGSLLWCHQINFNLNVIFTFNLNFNPKRSPLFHRAQETALPAGRAARPSKVPRGNIDFGKRSLWPRGQHVITAPGVPLTPPSGIRSTPGYDIPPLWGGGGKASY